MNKKQLIVMWCGILAILSVGNENINNLSRFIIWSLMISLVTGGLIYTIRDKKLKDEKKQ